MRSWSRVASRFLLPALPAGALALAVSWIGDYGAGIDGGDNPAPTIGALLHGNLGTAAHDQPIMGLVSILVRMPFVALAWAFGGGSMLGYRLGVFACGWIVGIVGVKVARWACARGRSPAGAAAIVALMVVNPVTIGIHLDGHPEELLGGALCVAAVLAAIDDRPMLAGAMLGLALGTKEWTLVAVVPVFLACRRDRGRMLLLAAVVAAPLVVALPLADPSAFARASKFVADLRFVYFRSWWWPLSDAHTVTIHLAGYTGTATDHVLPLHLMRGQVALLAPAVALGIGWRYARVARGHDPADALGLLALLLLLRCTLDPSFSSYYVVPFLIALLSWEALVRPGLPVGSLAGMAVFWLSGTFTSHPPAAACDLAVTLGLTVYLVRATLMAPRLDAAAPQEPDRSRLPAPHPAASSSAAR